MPQKTAITNPYSPYKLFIDDMKAPVIGPNTIITHVRETSTAIGSRNFRVFQSRSTANITMSMFPLWTHDLLNVTIPQRLLFEYVPLHRVLIGHWLKSEDKLLGGLLFPRGPFEMASLDPFVQILKQGRKGAPEDTGSTAKRYNHLSYLLLDDEADDNSNHIITAIQSEPPTEKMISVDLSIFVSRRKLCSLEDIKPFDPSLWHPASYAAWCDLYDHFAPIVQEECDVLQNNSLPVEACALLRRVMHTHFDDFGILFGQIWWDFGLGSMIPCTRVNVRSFMRGMLTDMFMVYHMLPEPPPVTTLFNPRSNQPGQRICAYCLALMLGKGQMMRCPCGRVYYCDAGCQKAHWKAHRVVCGEKAKK